MKLKKPFNRNLHRGQNAKIAKKLGVSTQAVSQWDVVPDKRVLDVESVIGIPRYVLRPDLYPPSDYKK